MTTDPAVAFVSTSGGNCTGTLVAPEVVLIAAHCISGANGGTVRFGNTSAEGEVRTIVDLFTHRFYDESVVRRFDIGMIRIDQQPAGIQPIPMNFDNIPEEFEGVSVRILGFGVTDGAGGGSGAGTKRQLTIPITRVTNEHLVVGNANNNICFGDSGGPTFINFNDGEKVSAVSSFTSGLCTQESFVTRTDAYEAMLKEIVAAWDGPCQADGNCVMVGCGDFPDPDCDPCGLNGNCQAGCDRVDLDCPPAGLLGEDCEDTDGCESRRCVEAPDDETVSFCTLDCSSDADCEAPITRCSDGQCVYSGTTDGALGASCQNSDECRAGICDPGPAVCARPCGGSSDAECPDPFVCTESGGQQICTMPTSSGGCSCEAPHGVGGPWAWLLLGAALFLWRRKRQR